MRRDFEGWWEEQRMLGTKYKYKSDVFGRVEIVLNYLNVGNEFDDAVANKEIAWLAWQAAFASLKQRISV